MPKYKALKKVWLSNECRTVEEGDIFETEFPRAPDGKPMRLGNSLVELDAENNPIETDEEGAPRRGRPPKAV
jgi:hypothetical protein